jgi:hypothetical protein
MRKRYLVSLLFVVISICINAQQSTFTIVPGLSCGAEPVPCDEPGTTICFGLELVPDITVDPPNDTLFAYGLTLLANCEITAVPINQSCVMTDVSTEMQACPGAWSITFTGQAGDTIVTDGVPLIIHEVCIPVELLEFNAWKSRSAVELSWRTASEVSNDRFEVERSRDGTSFTKIGTVKGHGTSFNHAYGFTDEQPYSGNNFYRLRQVDYDGKHAFSPIRVVQFGAASDGKELGLRVYPNPVKHLLNIELNQIPSEDYSIRLMDTNGSLVKEEHFSGEMMMQLNNVESGIYILQLINAQGELILVERVATFH